MFDILIQWFIVGFHKYIL